jgi:endonuclease/exonuclease/phosphatase family metal-dependent hydrolase
LSFASYNIHRCFGTDGHYRPERTVQVIEALDADIVGLQEVDMRLLVDGRPQLDYFGETLVMHAIPGPNNAGGASTTGRRGKFGNALLSRWPVRHVRRIDLSVRHFEPRGALDCRIDVDGTLVRVVVSHLGLNAAERRVQVERLLTALEPHPDDAPLVVMGDFNEWRPIPGALGGAALRGLDQRFGPSRTPRTFPSRLPILPLDRFWVWPEHGLRRLAVYTTPLSRITSDHLPLRAEVAWEAVASPPLALVWQADADRAATA